MRKFSKSVETVLRSREDLLAHVATHGHLRHCTLQDISLHELDLDWASVPLENTNFLGCGLENGAAQTIRDRGGLIYPPMPGLPYNPYRKTLYHWQELMEGYAEEDDQSLDYRIYRHFEATRFNPPIEEALGQRIHDHAIDFALRELLAYDDAGMTQRRCVGIMGGHSTRRDDVYFRRVAETACLLTQAGYYVASGGGPGTREAANLGAWMAAYAPEELTEALDRLARAPHYTDAGYLQAARDVLDAFPAGAESLAIPTWFYGHEPSNLFGTHIAKYFSNSIREDNLLAVSLHGVVFAPGSAGTTQEIFMDATQNHYGTFNFYSPMVFLSEKRYAIDTLIYPLIRQLSYGRDYHDLVTLTDDPEEVVDFLQAHPPVPKA